MTTPSIKRVGAFSPTSISGCQLWLDGSDTTSLTISSGAITQWRDKSGSSNHFGMSRGTATSIVDGGQYVVNFGEATVMVSTNQITFTTSSAFFIVSKMTSTNGAQNLIGFYPGLTNGFSLRFFSNVLFSGNSDDLSLGNYYVNGNFNPSYPSTTYYNTYSLISTTMPSRGATTIISLSDNWILQGFAQRFFIGNIAEFLYYPTGITSSQRQQVEGYLAQKWGLRNNLPGGHPGITAIIYPTPRRTGTVTMTVNLRPYYIEFSVTSVAGCQVWFDGADTSSMTFSGSNVTQWNDKSGKAFNATTPAGANSPTYLTATRELQFVDTNTNALRIAQGFGDALVGTTFSIFFVARRTTGSGYNYILGNPYEPKTSRTILMIGFFNNNMQTNTYSPEFNSSISTYSSPDPVRLYCFEVKSSSLATHILNGTQIGSDTQNYTLTSFTNPELGRRYGSIGHTFNLSEMIAFSPALTSTQRQQVESYLAQKWGLSSSLPSGHLNLTQPVGTPSLVRQIKRTIGVSNPTAPPVVSVRLINLNSASGGTTSGSFTVNSSTGGGTGTFTNSDVFLSSATWGMAQCFNGARSDYDLYMTQNPNFMEIVFPRALTVTKIFLVPRNQGDAFPSSLELKADGTSVGTYTPTTVSQSLGMGISYTGTGFYIQPSISRTTWRFDFSSTPVSFGEIEFWGYST
jgi:hypothetical protein